MPEVRPRLQGRIVVLVVGERRRWANVVPFHSAGCNIRPGAEFVVESAAVDWEGQQDPGGLATGTYDDGDHVGTSVYFVDKHSEVLTAAAGSGKVDS